MPGLEPAVTTLLLLLLPRLGVLLLLLLPGLGVLLLLLLAVGSISPGPTSICSPMPSVPAYLVMSPLLEPFCRRTNSGPLLKPLMMMLLLIGRAVAFGHPTASLPCSSCWLTCSWCCACCGCCFGCSPSLLCQPSSDVLYVLVNPTAATIAVAAVVTAAAAAVTAAS
jgi:hypothetical protein